MLDPTARGFEVLSATTGEKIGAIELAVRSADELEIAGLHIDEPRRGRGGGSEAFRLLLETLERTGWHTLCARAPEGQGLAAYFWMRMGFRPDFGAGRYTALLFRRPLIGD